MARASAHGLVVSKPWGDSARYDFAVEHKGRFCRVQVKSASYRHRNLDGSRYGYPCSTSRPSDRGSYAGHIDFFAFYIVPEDLWYIVPISGLRRGRARTFAHINPHNPRNFYFKYLEAWHLLKR